MKKQSPDMTARAAHDSSASPSAPADRGPWPGGVEPAPLTDAPTDPQRAYRSVGFTVSTTGYAIARRFRELLAPLGLEPRDFALLRTVATAEGVTQQAIGERMGVKPSRMVAFVDALEQRGLLERRQNPHDRRARELFLTEQGREVLQRAFATAVAHEQRLTSDLSPEEREQLLELLARVGSHLGIPRGVHAGMGHSALPDE
jgi:DNA-binding MarR family transcriptional regulator